MKNQIKITHLPPNFWVALITIHNNFYHLFTNHPWPEPPTPEGELAKAFRTLDCWLDVAVADGLHKGEQ